ILANNGIEANVGATGLKTGLARLAKPAKAGATAIERLGIEVFNADGSMKDSVEIQKILHDSFATLSEKEQLAAASAIFGKNQMATWLALINTAPEDVRKLDKSLSDCTGTTDKMAEAMMSGFGGSIERLKSGIDVLMTTLGRAVADAITPMIAKCQELVDWFSKLDDNSRSNIVTLGLFVAAVSPFLIITGQLITAIGTITTALGTLYTFLTLKLIPAIGTVASVIGWPIAIIGSIIVIVYELIDAIFGAGTAAKLISGIWQGACEFMKFCIQGVVDFVKGCIDIIVGAWNWVKENIFGIATETASAVEEMENKVENTVSNTATEIKNGQQHLRQDLRTTNAEIRSDTVLQWQETEQAVTSSSDNMSQKVMDALDKTKKSAKGSNKEITNLISSTKRTLLLENQNIAYNFSEIAQNLGNTLTTSVKDFDEYLGEFTSQGWEATEVYEEITKTISRLFYETGGDLQKVFDTLTGTVKDSTGKCWYMTEEMAKKSMKSVLSGMVEQQEKVLASNKEFGGKLKNELDTHTKQIQESLKKTLDFDWVAAFAKVKERGITELTATTEEISSLIGVLKDTLVKNNGDIEMSVKQLGEEYGVQEWAARKMFEVLDKETNIFLKTSKNASKSLVEDVKTINQQTLQQWQQNKNQTNSILTGLTGNVQNTFKQTRDTAINTTAEIRNSQAQQWGAIQTQTNSALKGISGGASNNFDNIKRQNLEMANYINTAWRNIQKNINESLHAIYSNVNTTFTNIKNSLQRAIIELKGLFNFEWSLPRIKVPHFKLEGKFDVEAGTVPRISVEWYKKAMNDAYILQSPTIFGMAGGKLLGGGEAGSEAVVGTEKLADLIKTAVASVSGGSTVIPVYIGQERIEEIVVRANQNVNYRSGGR
ncbi:MAG: phage tail tape measure protein, partial [Synergistaceae bacterium]|nr:phage tail tape measure protein [Synergistaceae bacterium]